MPSGPSSKTLSESWSGSTHEALDDLFNKHMFIPEQYPIVVLGSSYLAVQDDTRTYWGGDIPKGLDDKLRGRQIWLPAINVLCLGTDNDSYFVQFADGEAIWSVADDELSNFIQNTLEAVQSIALGSNNSYYCMWKDGTRMWNGIPTGLHNVLNGRQESLSSPDKVNLGPNGEWFVRFEDGHWTCNSVSNSCDETIDEIHKQGGEIYDIQFGHAWSWLIRYKE